MKTDCGILLQRYIPCLVLLLLFPQTTEAQASRLLTGAELKVEMSGTLTNGDYAPLWLSANRYGLSSVNTSSAYERVSLLRSEREDSARTLRMGYGIDMALMQHSAASFLINQAYLELAWWKLHVTAGSRRQPIDLRNQSLTSGGLGIGINAVPVPQLRFEVDYFDPFATHGWWLWKARLAYGWMTDNSYVNRYQSGGHRYTLDTRYHEKALYWRFGRADVFPLHFEIGLQMASQWAGTTYHASGRNHSDETLHHSAGLDALWNATVASGSDETDGVDQNTQGNHLGCYNMALSYRDPHGWGARAYFERYFEDQSMLTLQYGIQDHLLGLEIMLPKTWPVGHIVVEHLSTRNQSGAVYHDRTSTLPEKMNGRDNYYNHNLYNGWQHWGQTLGHPFLTSPIYTRTNAYDTSGNLAFCNNRVTAWHVGIDGDPTPELHYRLLFSMTKNWGTYDAPFEDMCRQNYFLVELAYAPRSLPYWQGQLGFGLDHGRLLGNSSGLQLTLSRSLSL